MNTTTKTWLLALLDAEEKRQRERLKGVASRTGAPPLELAMARIEDARRLVEQGPEEPTR